MHEPDGRARTEADGQRVGLDAWWLVFVLFLFYALSYIDRSLVAHIVDPIRASFNLSDFQISLIMGPAFAFAYAAASLPAGWLADKYDRRLVVLVGAMFWSLMTVACGLVTDATGLAIARMLVAVGEALLVPAGAALIADRFPPTRLATALGLYGTGAKAGTSLAYFAAAGALAMAGWMIATNQHFGREAWQLVFIVVGLPGVVLALLPLTLRKTAPTVTARRNIADAQVRMTDFLRQQKYVLTMLILGFLFLAVAAGAITAWLPTFMQRNYGWTAAQYGPWIGTITALAAVIALPKGLLSDWLYARGVRDASVRMLIWLTAISAPFCAAMFFLPGPYAFIACMGVVQVVALSYSVHTMTAIQLISPTAIRGRMIGLLTTVIPIFSQGLGPTSIGALTDFVFRDPQKLGAALAIVTTGGLTLSLVFLCLALPRVRQILQPSPAAA